MKTKKQTGTAGKETVQQFIKVEFIEFTKQLRVMNEWFLQYREKVNPGDDHILERLSEIESHLSETALNISDLVAIEFQEMLFYNL
jgi:hypothetical protein